jgi:hypothetical protein
MPQIPITTRIATDRPLVKVDNTALANPPAGQGFSLVVPTGYRFQPVALFFRLTTDANVAARNLVFTILTSSGILINFAPVFAFGPTEVRNFVFAPGVANILQSAAVFDSTTPICPDLTLQEGDEIRVALTGIQVGDQFSMINYQVLSQFVAE